MKNITEEFSDVYVPFKGIVVVASKKSKNETGYVESFDFSPKGFPINFHPLSETESALLLQTLSESTTTRPFLHIDGLIPPNVLHIHTLGRGQAIWYTPPQMFNLIFKEHLKIPSGNGYAPMLIWKASRTQLYLYASKSISRPRLDTPLCHAPFLNIRSSGHVCMGTVQIAISESCSLQEFMKTWQNYFFNSYFSSILNASSVKGDIAKVWKSQIEKGTRFPSKILKEIRQTINDIL
jgi:PRTRC genetic system protein B